MQCLQRADRAPPSRQLSEAHAGLRSLLGARSPPPIILQRPRGVPGTPPRRPRCAASGTRQDGAPLARALRPSVHRGSHSRGLARLLHPAAVSAGQGSDERCRARHRAGALATGSSRQGATPGRRPSSQRTPAPLPPPPPPLYVPRRLLPSFSCPRFFPSMVYLSSSKFSLAVLGNLGFAMALATYKIVLRASRPPPLPACLPLLVAAACSNPLVLPPRLCCCVATARTGIEDIAGVRPSVLCRSSWAGCGTARWSE